MYVFTINVSIIAVPSGFTPNGDGVNDILMVLGGPVKELDFRIYNEWGNELFRSTEQSKGWDATYKGKAQPAARYIYLVKYTTFDDVQGELKGDVTIIR
jgi:gliding motility-associated-like protein